MAWSKEMKRRLSGILGVQGVVVTFLLISLALMYENGIFFVMSMPVGIASVAALTYWTVEVKDE